MNELLDRIRLVLRMVKAGPWSVGAMKWRMYSAHAILILILSTAGSPAAIVNALSPNFADVQAAHNACANGDTLRIPAGTAVPWTNQLLWTKNITIQGAGTNLTFLVKGNPEQDWHGLKPLFYVTAPGVWRIRDLSIDGQWTSGGKGIVVAGGFGRIDHITFRRCYDRAVQTFAPIGLIDHCMDTDSWAFAGHYADQYAAWTRPLWIGTTNAWVIEDCYFAKTGAYYAPVVDDGGWGARYTFRHNIVSNLGLSNFDYALDAHGNQGKPFGDPALSIAGTVFLESYYNTFSMGTANRATILRGGTQIHYNNRITATGGNLLTFSSVFPLSEEDGYRPGNPIVTAWPAYQQITNSYFWGNDYNGASNPPPNLEFPGTTPCLNPAGCGAPWPSDGIFMQEGRDYWRHAPSTNFYRPLQYPHPRIVAENSPTIPATFTLTSPANGATGVAADPLLSWTGSSGHTHYQLIVSRSFYMDAPVWDITMSPGSLSYNMPAGLLSTNTTYYWLMRAIAANAVNTSSDAPFRFTTGTGGPPTIPGSFSLSASMYSVDEDDGQVTITVNRVGGSDGAVSVAYGTTAGTATPGVNYSTTSGTLSWVNGETAAKTFNVPIINDGVYSSPLNFTVSISSPTGGATLGAITSATVTINNVNPPPGPPLLPLTFFAHQALITAPFQTNAAGEVFQTTQTTLAAGGRIAAFVNIPATRKYRIKAKVRAPTTANNSFGVDFDSDPPADPTAVWSIVPLTAATGTESRYVDWLGNGTATSQFPTNQWNLTAGIHAIYFRGREANTFLYEVTIEPVPIPGLIQLSAAVYSVPENGGTITITARRVNGSDGAVSINYGTQNGTAVAGINYVAAANTLSWADGETADKTFTVQVINDGLFSPDLTFSVLLSNPTGGAAIGSPETATVTVMNTNPPPLPTPGTIQLTVNAMSVNEDVVNATISARRANGTDGVVGVSYGTQNGTAQAGVNYTTTSGSLTWLDGDSTEKNFTVPIINDGSYGPDLTFNVILSSPTGGATLGNPATNVVTILNVNNPPVPPTPQQVGWSSPGESAWEGSTILFTVLRFSGTNGTVYVNYESVAGTAIPGIHYTPVSGTITFAEGDTSATIAVQLIENTIYDVNKYFTMVLSNPVNASIIGPSDSLGVLVENDAPPPRGIILMQSGNFKRLILGRE